jgi:DNA-directed RNA polymerase specialized sigma subunit
MNENIRLVLDSIFAIVIDCNPSPKEKKANISVYRNVLDNFAICLVTDSFENEKVLKAIMKLSAMERVIIVFHFVLALNLNEISVVIHASPESVYSQKSMAIKKMRLMLAA